VEEEWGEREGGVSEPKGWDRILAEHYLETRAG
jgi:hypothetical protein